MKKVIRSVLLMVLVLSLSIVMVPSASAASSTTAQNKASVYRFLTNTLGLNRAAACGIMANVEKESNFNPKSVCVDSNGKLSGGLFQWNGSRFSNLKNFCSKYGYDYLSISGQMSYLKSELNTSSYKYILNYVKGVSNSSSGAYNAGYYWCYYYERPANKSSRSVERGNIAKKYFSDYSASGVTTPSEPAPVSLSTPSLSTNASNGKISLYSDVKLTWTSAGSACSGYEVKIAKYEKGDYNWKSAIVAVSSVRNFTIASADIGAGKYAAKVVAKSNSASSKTSSTVYFSIVCTNHFYSTKVTKKATETATGVLTYTCQLCGAKTTQKLSPSNNSVKSLTTPNASASLGSNGIATVKCSGTKNADGYSVYVYGGSSWIKLGSVPASSTSCKVPNLYSGAKIKVVAFKIIGSKTVTSSGKTFTL